MTWYVPGLLSRARASFPLRSADAFRQTVQAADHMHLRDYTTQFRPTCEALITHLQPKWPQAVYSYFRPEQDLLRLFVLEIKESCYGRIGEMPATQEMRQEWMALLEGRVAFIAQVMKEGNIAGAYVLPSFVVHGDGAD